MMTMWYGSGWAWWQVGLMWVAVVVFLVLLIWAVCVLVSGITRRPDQALSRGPERPQRILGERLARGEIDATEYRRLRGLLDGGTSTLER
jgi:putative membrane protein